VSAWLAGQVSPINLNPMGPLETIINQSAAQVLRLCDIQNTQNDFQLLLVKAYIKSISVPSENLIQF
jgi:hypothetical protein